MDQTFRAGGPVSGRRRQLIGALLTVVMLITLAGRQHVTFADTTFLNWAQLLPSLVDTFDPNSTNDCVAGRPHCVDATIAEMQERFDPLGQSCNHNSMFSLAYLRTTQTYEWARNQAGYFYDTAWVNHEDAVFGKYYFAAYDAWAAGSRSQVPQAWLIALDAAAARGETGGGDLLLGMNAHVNRDLPFVLAAIGIVTPDGLSRKPDHDKVNQFLNAVVQPLLVEQSARLDPTMNDIATPYGVGYTGLFQMLAAWRESAWRNAELLVDAPTSSDRALVAQNIETAAADQATMLAASNAYVPPATTTASRDTFCAANNATAPPMSYAFGTPTAY